VEVEEHLAVKRLREAYPRAVLGAAAQHNEVTVLVARDAIEPVCRFLRDDPDLAFDFLSDLTGVDRLHLTPSTPRFEVVVHLKSIGRNHRLRVKIPVAV